MVSETILAIQLYAELLLNIKSLTLSGTIRSKATQDTKATLTTDGSEICVRHEGSEATIRVPAKTIGKATATLDVPANCTEPINARVQIEGDLSDLITLRDDHSGNISPWSAPSLSLESSVLCATCSTPLVRPRAISDWKDLPSDNWAEMMDFWHCHKPEPAGDAANEAGALKGYGAGSKLQAAKRTGLVNQSTFLLDPSDCLVIKDENTCPEDRARPAELRCPQCSSICGAVDSFAAGWRLYKWRLTVASAAASTQSTKFPVEKWLSSILLTTAETRGVRKFLLKNASSSEDALLLWLFTPDLYFCSANSGIEHVSDASRGLKVLRQTITPAAVSALETASSTEELDLPNGLDAELRAILSGNTDMLPGSMRRYQDWNVSLLRRFSPQDVSGKSESSATVTGDPGHASKYTDAYLNQYL